MILKMQKIKIQTNERTNVVATETEVEEVREVEDAAVNRAIEIKVLDLMMTITNNVKKKEMIHVKSKIITQKKRIKLKDLKCMENN